MKNGVRFQFFLDTTSNREVGTAELGTLPAGRHNFTWDTSGYMGEGRCILTTQSALKAIL